MLTFVNHAQAISLLNEGFLIVVGKKSAIDRVIKIVNYVGLHKMLSIPRHRHYTPDGPNDISHDIQPCKIF